MNYSTIINITFNPKSIGCRGWGGICVWTESQRSAGTWPPHRNLNSSALPQPDSDGDKRNLWLGFYSVSHWWVPRHSTGMVMLINVNICLCWHTSRLWSGTIMWIECIWTTWHRAEAGLWCRCSDCRGDSSFSKWNNIQLFALISLRSLVLRV